MTGSRSVKWIVGIMLVMAIGCRPTAPREPDTVETLLNTSQSESESESQADGWEKALEPREFVFPRDHGSHPEYQIEWWYYTGNLTSTTGRRIGYQLTFFRFGLQPDPTNPSRWTARDLYIAHFALSDPHQQRLTKFERTSRAGVDWAGADEIGSRVWNGDWQLLIDQQVHHLTARQDDFAIDLQLTSRKPPALHGTAGLSRKGAQPGNASHYYSLTRLETRGQATLNGETFTVEGLSWMDHEFSSSFLEQGQSGWDWFSLQLSDGSELMIYQIRSTGGETETTSSGTLVAADGSAHPFDGSQYRLTPLHEWHSKETGATYPTRWRFEMPSRNIDLEIEAVFAGQEMNTRDSTGIIYWEGCVDVSGQQNGHKVQGRGYLEMTGYAGDLGALFDSP